MKLFTMKRTTLLLIACLFSTLGSAQINSNPGAFNWNTTAAWSGGVIPGPTDGVNIGLNSTINLDLTLVHNADINIDMGGMLTSSNPVFSLTMNDADLTITSGQLVFAGGVAAVPVTINNGLLINNGFYTSGNLYVSYATIGSSSLNNGDFIISGTMDLADKCDFVNNLAVIVSSDLTISTGSALHNNQLFTVGTITNDGIVDNLGSVNLTSFFVNNTGGVVTSSGGLINVGSEFMNFGTATISDSMHVINDLRIMGIFTNNGGAVTIVNGFHNHGTTTGSLGGQFWVANASENHPDAVINGDIDICDATLLPGAHLDLDSNTAGVDFGTVTFCTLFSTNSINEEAQNAILVSPNPTSGNVTINGVSTGEYQVFSNDGRVVLQGTITDSSTLLNLDQFQSGTYRIVVQHESGILTQQIIKR
jgi:hypothetical protein